MKSLARKASQDMKFLTMLYQAIHLGIIEFIGVVQVGGGLVKVLQVLHGGKNLPGQGLVKNINNG